MMGNGVGAAHEPLDGEDFAPSDWEPPVGFSGEMHGPPVPLEALPASLSQHAVSVAAAVKVPVDLIVAGELAAVAASAARRAEIAIGSTHVEPLNLYVMPVASPGERKPVAVREAIFPLEQEERRLIELALPTLNEARQTAAIGRKRIERLHSEAAKADDAGTRRRLAEEAATLEASLDALPIVEPSLIIDDATPEYLARALGEQGGRIFIASEEAGTLIGVAAGLYSKNGEANLDAILKAYDGGTIKVGRVTRDRVFVERPALSILVTAQPAILDKIAANGAFRGRGFVGRVAFVVPESMVGSRLYEDRAIDPVARARYAEILTAILRLPLPATASAIPRLRLDGAALAAWAAFADQVEREQAPGGRLVHVRDWASKHPGRVARLIGLFHLVLAFERGEDPFTTPIEAETAVAAWAIGDWLTEHALAAFSAMGTDSAEPLARKLLAWIRREGHRAFSLRDAYRVHRDVDRKEDFTPAIEILEGRGFVRPIVEPRREGPGRPRSPRWEVNPAVHRDSGDSGNSALGGLSS